MAKAKHLSIKHLSEKHLSIKHLSEIILIGRSNVGKSSLMRALTGIKVKVGKRPGVTLKPNFIYLNDLLITDLPGFGYMDRVSRRKQEEIKDFIVRYIEENAKRIVLAILVIDACTVMHAREKCRKQGEMPIDVELYELLSDLKIDTIIAVNKLDKLKFEEQEKRMDEIVELFGLLPPWTQWIDQVAPISAKLEEISDLKRLMKKKLKGKGIEFNL
jgi:GTP-binding protein EngB required for normal cell division